jgi:hypothetical protein
MGRAAVMEERGSLVTPARSLTEQIKNNLKKSLRRCAVQRALAVGV